jgi:hypothetical protein
MNERIQDLYKQSANQDYFPIDSEEVYMSAKDLKKFAELIVTECAVLINDERRAFNPTEWDQGADWGHKNAVDAITKHFGVEE